MRPVSDRPKPHKSRVSETDDFTLMIIRGAGKLRSFRMSPPVFYGGLILLTLCIIASILFIHLYFGTVQVTRDQSRRLAVLQGDIRDTREALQGAKERLELLEGHIANGTGDLGQDAQSTIPGRERSTLMGGVAQMLQKGSVLDVQRFTARKKGLDLKIRFRLVNIDPDNRAIRGYVVMIGINTQSDPPLYCTYPKLALKKGVPVNFEDGEYFKIRNYRTIRGRYSLEPGTSAPGFIKILAYDEAGRLIMKKEMPLDEKI